MGRDSKYKYADWWEGRIYFSGAAGPTDGFEAFEQKYKRVDYIKLSASDEKRIKQKQKILFEQTVSKRFQFIKRTFLKLLSNSSEKDIFVRGTIIDLNIFFDQSFVIEPDSLLSFTFLDVAYTSDEIRPFRKFYEKQIVKGRRSYSFMQSPNLNSEYLEKPPVEVKAEAFHRFLKWLINKYPNWNQSEIGSEIVSPKLMGTGFEFSKFVKDNFLGKRKELERRIAIWLDNLKNDPYKYVGKAVSITDFKKLFSGELILSKVLWTGSVAELSYFIKGLRKKDIIETRGDSHWQFTLNSFEAYNKYNEPATLKMLSSPSRVTPDSKKHLDSIIDQLMR